MSVIRLAQIGIVLFWLVMTGLQVRLVAFPESSRLAVVPVSEVVQAFVSRRAGSTLSILDRGKELGRLTVKPKRLPKESGLDDGAEIMLAGGLDAIAVGDEIIKVRLVSRLWLDGKGSLRYLQLGFRMPRGEVEADIEYWPARDQFSYRITESGKVVFDSESSGGPADSLNAKARLLLAAWGVDLASFGKKPVNETVEGSLVEASAWASRIEIGGQSVAAYVLEVPVPMFGETKLRFIITRHGELERVEGVMGYEISSAAEDVEIALDLEGREGE